MNPNLSTLSGIFRRIWSRPLVTILRWFDSSPVGESTSTVNDRRVDWIRCLPFVFMHTMCLGVIWVGWSPTAVVVAVIFYLMRMLAITGFYHRYFSHRSFKTSRAMQFTFALLGASAVQRGPLWWASHHRHHHTNSDRDTDSHSPYQHGFFWSHMGWFTCEANFAPRLKFIPDLVKYAELRFLDRFDVLVPFLFALLVYALGFLLGVFAPELGTNGPQMLVWGFFISTVLLYHATFTVNSLAHRFGSRRYNTGDQSRNNLWLALVTLGEGWHNNHHHYPRAARQGFYWWEIDITYYFLLLLESLGLIWDLRPVPIAIRNTASLSKGQ